MKLSASVIICTRNRLDDSIHCLTALAQQTLKPYEIIIVDSSDVALTCYPKFNDMFEQYRFPGVYLHYLHTRPGLTYQRNRGIEHVTGDVMYFLDDDSFIFPDYLEQMNTVFEQYPLYAGGMGSIANMQAYRYDLYRFIRILFLLPRDYASGNFTASGMPTHAYGTTTFKSVQVVGGCCMAFRATILRRYLFDERLTRYAAMEDCDISKRISDYYPLFFNPAAQLYHFNSPVSRDALVDNRAMYIHNYSYLFFKNVYPTNKYTIVFYAWSMMGLFIEALVMRNKEYLKGYVRGIKRYYSKRV